jgi:hypothetical protein
VSPVQIPSRSSLNVPAARSSQDAVRAVSNRRVRRLPYAVAGAMITVSAVVFVAVEITSMGGKSAVLVVAQPVQVGQVLTADDLKSVDVSTGALAQTVSADDEAQVVGRPAALPLMPGEVLTSSLVGSALWPPANFAVASAQLKPGSFPPHLTAGAHVQVVAPASAAGAAAQVVAGAATVTDVSVPTDQGDVVVSVLADKDAAKAVASALPGSLSLVLLPVGG